MTQYLSNFQQSFTPSEVLLDPVEKLRVSQPQTMMDTDFEYSLQSSKWETVGMSNNSPSVFVAANEPAFTNDLITYIRPAAISASVAGANTFQTLSSNIPTDRGSTGLTTLFGSFTASNGTDEWSVPVSFPAGFNQNYAGSTFTFGTINANSWFSFGVNTTSGFSGSQTNPSVPTFHIASVNNGSTDNNLAFAGTEEYIDAFWGPVFRIRYHGNRIYSENIAGNQTRWDLYFIKNQPSLYLIVFRQFVADGSGQEQLGASTGTSWIDVKFNSTTPFSGTAWSFFGPASLYSLEVKTTTAHGRAIGDPVSIRESAASSVDGAYLIATVPDTTTFRYFPRTTDPSIEIETNKTGTYSQSGNNVTVSVTNHKYKVGDQIYIDASSGLLVDGTYEVSDSPVPTTNQFTVRNVTSQTTSGSLTVFKNYRTPYTAIYTGGFYTNSSVTISSIIQVIGTNRARITFVNPHGLFLGNGLYVVDPTVPLADWVGAFTIEKVLSPFVVEYTTRSGSIFAAATTLSTTAVVYVKSDAVALHRSGDGGVQINPGSNAPNVQVIRQTRKYFRYQSGKGLQFSTGVLFRPVYDINSVSVDSSTVGSGYITMTVETEVEHGLTPAPDAGGSQITFKGFTVSNGTNPYNTTTTVLSSPNLKTFTCRIPTLVAPEDTAPGGLRQVEIKTWNDATVRTGMFDEQNGMFFEYDGKNINVVRRTSTQQLAGTVSVISGSAFVYGTKTKFLSSVSSGDYVVINGTSCIVNEVYSDTKLSISPRYRASVSANNSKMFKTIDIRIAQKDFSIDSLDGTGPSGYVLDPNRMQMVFIDYSWYGAGKIRFGIRAEGGGILYFHHMPQNNINTEAYMRSGNLPGRFEIRNTCNRCFFTSDIRISTAFTSTVSAGSDTVTITSANHGLQDGNTIFFDFASSITDGFYEILSATTNQFQIRLNTAVKDAASPNGTFYRSIASFTPASVGSPHIVSVTDASMFPNNGRIMVANEYMRYVKANQQNVSYSVDSENNVTFTVASLATLGILAGTKVNVDFSLNNPANGPYEVLSIGANSFVINLGYVSGITSGTALGVYGNTRLNIIERNTAGMSAQVNTSQGDVVFSVNQNCAPALSHWGVSVIMDGRFDEDKSYLFTAATRNNVNFNNTLVEKPLVSIRLAPSADYGVPRDYGVRSLINRSALTLKNVGIYAKATGYQITVRINSSSTAFNTSTNWLPVGNGSLAQYLDHSAVAGTVTGGDVVFQFFAEEGTNKFTLTQQDIDFIRDLGNSVLGGSRSYPDGPDVLTIYAQPIVQVSTLADVRSRISFTEAQG